MDILVIRRDKSIIKQHSLGQWVLTLCKCKPNKKYLQTVETIRRKLLILSTNQEATTICWKIKPVYLQGPSLEKKIFIKNTIAGKLIIQGLLQAKTKLLLTMNVN
jgi:hypothetical protein